MDERLRRRLRIRRPAIRRAWEALLREGPVATPLGHPDVLAHLMGRTLNAVLASLGDAGRRFAAARPGAGADLGAACLCGRNPLLAYYQAGERALREALLQAAAEPPALSPEACALAVRELARVIGAIGRRDVELFCSLCLYRDAGLRGEAVPSGGRDAAAVCANAPGGRRHVADPAPAARAAGRPARRPFQASGLGRPSPAPGWR